MNPEVPPVQAPPPAQVPQGNIINMGNLPAGGLFTIQNMAVVILAVLSLLSILGINLFNIFGNVLENVKYYIGPLIEDVIILFGNITGTAINASADVATGVAKTGIDIAGGTVHSVGNLLENRPNPGKVGPTELDITINDARIPNSIRLPEYDNGASPIQKPISANKSAWCLVGEYQNKRGCVEVGEADKCMSGQVFPNQQMCLNPNFTQNRP